MVIVLLGYMASGKSTIGKVLAEKMGYKFIDLDAYIEKKEQTIVGDLFKNKGEIYFRKVESAYLKEIVNRKENIVLSLGGGTPCYANNMDILINNDQIVTIYLKATIGTLIARLKNEKDTRPLISHLKNEEVLVEFIGKHLFERSVFYNQAKIIVSTDGKKSTRIIEDIMLNLF